MERIKLSTLNRPLSGLLQIRTDSYKQSVQNTMKQLNNFVCDYEAYNPYLEKDYSNAMFYSNVFHEMNLRSQVKNAQMNDAHNLFSAFSPHDKNLINSTHDVYFYYGQIGLKKLSLHDVENVLNNLIQEY